MDLKVKATQSCQTLCNPMDYTVHGILQARILDQVANPFSRGSFHPRERTWVSHIAKGFFTSWATREARWMDLVVSKRNYTEHLCMMRTSWVRYKCITSSTYLNSLFKVTRQFYVLLQPYFACQQCYRKRNLTWETTEITLLIAFVNCRGTGANIIACWLGWLLRSFILAKRVSAPGGRSPKSTNTVVADFPAHPPTLSNGMGDDQSTDIKLPYPHVSGSLALHSGFYLSRYCISGLYKVKSSHSTPGQQCFPES